MKIWKLAAGLACAAALTACAGGGSRGGGPSSDPIRALLSADVMMFVSFDADGDAVVTNAEIDAGLTREFARADSNGDGQLQPIEFQNWSHLVLGGGMLGPYRLDFDRNVDNVITREEFNTEIHARVRDYDQDQSSSLTRTEFVRLVGQARPPANMPRPGEMTRPPQQ